MNQHMHVLLFQDCVEVFFDALKRMPDGYEPHSIYNMIGRFMFTLFIYILKKLHFLSAFYSTSLLIYRSSIFSIE